MKLEVICLEKVVCGWVIMLESIIYDGIKYVALAMSCSASLFG